MIGVNNIDSALPNLYVFVSTEDVGWGIQVLNDIGQHISIFVNYQNVCCYLTFVYASTSYVIRRRL